MASNVKASIVLFISLNLFLLVSSHNVDYDSNGSPYTTNPGNPVVIPLGNGLPNGNNAHGQSGTTNSGNPIVIRPGNVLSNGNNNNQGQNGTCNPLNLGVCLNLLGLVKVDLGDVPTEPCCSVIKGLLDLEAAVCLCTAVRANVLGINIDLPISLNLVLNNCGKRPATEYICAPSISSLVAKFPLIIL